MSAKTALEDKRGSAPKRHTLESYQKLVDEKFGENKMKVLEFSSSSAPITIQCVRCGRRRTMSSARKILTTKKPCFYCDKNPDEQEEIFLKKMNEVFGEGEYSILEYGDAPNPKLLLRHKCGFIFSCRYQAALESKGCPKCSRKSRKREQKGLEI